MPPDLIERAMRGEMSARHALLDLHRDDLRRMVRARLDRRISVRLDPSDVVQDVLIEAWRRLDGYLRERPLPFLAWLRQIVRERIIDTHRRHISSQRRGIHREERPLDRSHPSAADLAGCLVINHTSPSDLVARDEAQCRLEQAIVLLPSKDREILMMRHIEQLGTVQIASALGISEGAVKARLFRALLRLRGLMKSEC